MKLARRLMCASLVGALAASPALAYDPATTHAGLTERAVMASALHKVLSRRLGRPLGLLEPLQIHSKYFEPTHCLVEDASTPCRESFQANRAPYASTIACDGCLMS